MGERLVLTINKGGETIMAFFDKYGAYTSNALSIVKGLAAAIDAQVEDLSKLSNESVEEICAFALHQLADAVIDEDDGEQWKSAHGNSDGLFGDGSSYICISEEMIDEFIDAGEMHIGLDVDGRTVDLYDAFWELEYEDAEEKGFVCTKEGYWVNSRLMKPENDISTDYSIKEVPFSELANLEAMILKAEGDGFLLNGQPFQTVE